MHEEFYLKSSTLSLYTKQTEGGQGVVIIRAKIKKEAKTQEYIKKMAPNDDLLIEYLRDRNPVRRRKNQKDHHGRINPCTGRTR